VLFAKPWLIVNKAAWITIVIHALGLVFAVFGLRAGTPLVPLDDRVTYLATWPWPWMIGWAVWMLCAVCLFWFLVLLGCFVPSPHSGSHVAIGLAGVGCAVDLVSETLYIGLLPRLAGGGSERIEQFLLLERVLGASSAIVANGLYSFAVLIMAHSLARRRDWLVGLSWLAWATFVCGMAMVVAGMTGRAEHLELATGPTIVLFCAWIGSVAHCLGKGAVL